MKTPWSPDGTSRWHVKPPGPLPPPVSGISDFVGWIDGIALPGNPVFVAVLAAYDWKWVDHYCLVHHRCNLFGHGTATDVKTFAGKILGGNFYPLSVRGYPPEWFAPCRARAWTWSRHLAGRDLRQHAQGGPQPAPR